MNDSQALAGREYAIRQGTMRNLYAEGTGSVIDEGQSAPFQGVPRVWMLSIPTNYSCSATAGVCIVLTKYQIDHPEVITEGEFNLKFAPHPVAMSPASILDTVRTVFGLNISETADVFGITRQTAYQWMQLTGMEQVRSHENRDRLKQLYSAARSWQNHPQLKGRWLHALLPAGNTVLDLLKSSPVDLDALQAAYQVLSTSTADRRREEGARATQAATALTGAFAGLGVGRKARKV